jgi:hypothetical protein
MIGCEGDSIGVPQLPTPAARRLAQLKLEGPTPRKVHHDEFDEESKTQSNRPTGFRQPPPAARADQTKRSVNEDEGTKVNDLTLLPGSSIAFDRCRTLRQCCREAEAIADNQK